jgi:hypothetical protein
MFQVIPLDSARPEPARTWAGAESSARRQGDHGRDGRRHPGGNHLRRPRRHFPHGAAIEPIPVTPAMIMEHWTA